MKNHAADLTFGSYFGNPRVKVPNGKAFPGSSLVLLGMLSMVAPSHGLKVLWSLLAPIDQAATQLAPLAPPIFFAQNGRPQACSIPSGCNWHSTIGSKASTFIL